MKIIIIITVMMSVGWSWPLSYQQYQRWNQGRAYDPYNIIDEEVPPTQYVIKLRPLPELSYYDVHQAPSVISNHFQNPPIADGIPPMTIPIFSNVDESPPVNVNTGSVFTNQTAPVLIFPHKYDNVIYHHHAFQHNISFTNGDSDAKEIISELRLLRKIIENIIQNVTAPSSQEDPPSTTTIKPPSAYPVVVHEVDRHPHYYGNMNQGWPSHPRKNN